MTKTETKRMVRFRYRNHPLSFLRLIGRVARGIVVARASKGLPYSIASPIVPSLGGLSIDFSLYVSVGERGSPAFVALFVLFCCKWL